MGGSTMVERVDERHETANGGGQRDTREAPHSEESAPGSASTAQPVLTGPRVVLRDPRPEDTDALLATLCEPEVAEWWVGYTRERVEREMVGSPDTVRVIEVEGRAVGGLVVLRGKDPEYPTTIMHIYTSTSMRGRRLGQEALALAIRHEFAHGIARVTLDPNVRNLGAIRSYERLGFKRVGVLRDYQVRPDGSLDDSLLLDLTRSDFPDGPPLPDVPSPE